MADNDREDPDQSCEANGISAVDENCNVTEKAENNTTQKNDKEKKPGFVNAIRQSIRRGVINPLSPKKQVLHAISDDNTDTSVQPPESLQNVKETGQDTTKAAEPQMSYTLPEIPKEPLSVMQIDRLIREEILDDAYVNMLSLQQEFENEVKALDKEAYPITITNKEKDLMLLFKTLKDKLTEIVRHSCGLPSPNKELLMQVAYIIQENEKRNEDTGRMGGLRVAWKSAVKDGVNGIIKNVNLDSHETNPSWLAVHLGQVGKVTVEELINVKAKHVSAYPTNFNVFDTYVSAFRDVVSEHIRQLFPNVTERKDNFALLDFIINRFSSDKIMGHSSLQPEIKEEQKTLNLDEAFLEQMKTLYCKHLQDEVKLSLNKITELERDEMWQDQKHPTVDDALYMSQMHMDIWMHIESQIQASSWLDVNMEQRAMCCCLEELRQFPKQFESVFVQWSTTVQDASLWAEYHITYINSFAYLKEHMENYKTRCPDQIRRLNMELDEVVGRLCHALLEHFKSDTMPFLGKMMTRNWLSSDKDFQDLYQRIEALSQKSKHMIPQHQQIFVSDIHYYVVKEYVSQMMKNKISCKNRKNENAATKIDMQWSQLSELFQEMNSSQHWLYPVGNHLKKIIGETNKSEIHHHLQPLVNEYPDFSTRHLTAVLYFSGIIQGRDKQMILEQFFKIKQHNTSAGSTQHALFSDIKAAESTGCLSNMPFTCFSVFTSDS